MLTEHAKVSSDHELIRRAKRAGRLSLFACSIAVGACEARKSGVDAETLDWPSVTGDVAGSRFSRADKIHPGNVSQLRVAWMRQLGDSISRNGCVECAHAFPRFEATPVSFDGLLIAPTPLGNVVALDAGTGESVWRYESRVDTRRRYAEGLTTRGISLWTDGDEAVGAACQVVVFHATVDARLHAISARTGELCSSFGENGVVDLAPYRLAMGTGSSGSSEPASVTSPPLVVKDVVVVGATGGWVEDAMEDHSGVLAFDARVGTLRWRFRTSAPSTADSNHSPPHALGANVWSLMSADTMLGLIFLPVGGPKQSHLGAARPGTNLFANSVVAIAASDGHRVWSFQLIHHDLWDYDVATQPVLVQVKVNDTVIEAVVGLSKAGEIFLLDRRSGEPLEGAEERPVPRSDVLGEASSRTQPRGWKGIEIEREPLTELMLYGETEAERIECVQKFRAMRYDGLFTPPSRRGSIVWPGVWGGPNWDGAAWDAERQTLILPVRRVASIVTILSRSEVESRGLPRPGEQRFVDRRSGMVVVREPFVSSRGYPCTRPPWSALVGLNLARGAIAWSVPLGGDARRAGGFAFGGPLVTSSGLTFVGATQDDRIRALATMDGRLLWEHKLPAGGQSAPMTYVNRGRQFVGILAGGRGGIGTPGDWLVTFALPKR